MLQSVFNDRNLPGAELVQRGVRDLAAGTLSAEALLISRFAGRLSDVGVRLPAAPIPDAERRLYQLLAERNGLGAHSAYNSLTRRLVSYLNARERAPRS
jgi:hypothetical protein